MDRQQRRTARRRKGNGHESAHVAHVVHLDVRLGHRMSQAADAVQCELRQSLASTTHRTVQPALHKRFPSPCRSMRPPGCACRRCSTLSERGSRSWMWPVVVPQATSREVRRTWSRGASDDACGPACQLALEPHCTRGSCSPSSICSAPARDTHLPDHAADAGVQHDDAVLLPCALTLRPLRCVRAACDDVGRRREGREGDGRKRERRV
jgi:hypothetical protein